MEREKSMKRFIAQLILLVFHPFVLQAAETIKVAYPSTSYTTVPILVGMRQGFFQREGLRLELILMRPNISITALVNGQVEFATVHGSIVRAAARGVPVKSVLVMADRPAYYLVSKSAIRSVGALKGRSVGVTSLGGSVHLMTKELFANNGLDPEKDISIVVTGDHHTSIQALQGGSVDAVVISVPWQVVAEKAGFHKLIYFGDAMRLAMAGLGTADENLKKRPEVIKKAIRATLQGIEFVRDTRNKKEVIKVMNDWFKISGDIAQEAYDQMIEAYPLNGMASDEVLEKDLEISRQVGAIKGQVPLSRVVDFQLLKEARNELSGKR